MASDRDLYVSGRNVSTPLALISCPLFTHYSVRRAGLTLAAKSIVRSKTIASGSIVLVIEIARLRGGEGVSVFGRGVRDPLAVGFEGSRWPIMSAGAVYIIYSGLAKAC
jgi:hypothetical protein